MLQIFIPEGALARSRFPTLLRFTRIQPRRRSASPTEALVEQNLARARQISACEAVEFRTERDLLEWLARPERRGRTPVVLCDSRGLHLTSEDFAARLNTWLERSVPEIVLAIGPADGWSEAARERADLTLAFGRMTLPHELAAVVLAEQMYRALTILTGHPYHAGH